MASGPLANRESSSPLPSPISSPMGLLPLCDTESSHAWKLINLNFSCQSSQHHRYRTRTNICQARCWFLPSIASFFIFLGSSQQVRSSELFADERSSLPDIEITWNFCLDKDTFPLFFPLFSSFLTATFLMKPLRYFFSLLRGTGVVLPFLAAIYHSDSAQLSSCLLCVSNRVGPDERMCVCACVFVCSSSPNAFFSHSDAGWRMMVKLSLSAATIVEAPVSMWRLSYVDSACSGSKIAGRVWPLEAVMADTNPSDK